MRRLPRACHTAALPVVLAGLVTVVRAAAAFQPAVAVDQDGKRPTAARDGVEVSLKEAIAKARQVAPAGTPFHIHLATRGEVSRYDVRLLAGDGERLVHIDAHSGETLKNSS